MQDEMKLNYNRHTPLSRELKEAESMLDNNQD